MPHLVSQRIYYSGRVQGVGFRYSVKQISLGFEVVGGVRNLPDGRVEVEATGEGSEVAAFVEAIGSGQLAPHIKQVEISSFDGGDRKPSGFDIWT